jgi:general stress protein 26
MAVNLIGEWQALDSALADRVPCLIGTADKLGQAQISPKGSMMVFDATRLAYWERARRTAIANIKANPKVIVFYRNPALKLALRFYGIATAVTEGALFEAVWSRTIPAEQEKDPERKGMAVVIDVNVVNDLSGKILQQA